jgi:hypothetical protein
MKKYIGTKVINAIPMNRQEYVNFRGWKLPQDENGADEGYLVEYTDGGKPNTPQYAGYVSWSPKDVFEKSYHELSGMNFGMTIEALRLGLAVRRKGWNGKGLFVVKQIPAHIGEDIIPNMQSLPQSAKDIIMGRENKHIDYTSQMLIINPDCRADSWVPSSSDVFAEDWEII